MMSLLAFFIGVALPTVIGWLLIKICEGKQPVLFRSERWIAAFLVGMTGMMFVHTMLQITLGIPFSFIGFMSVQMIVLLTLLGVCYKRSLCGLPSPKPPSSSKISKTAIVLLGLLLGWTAIKIITGIATLSLLTPSYYQDTLSNWNLRGKVLYETQELTLVMPAEDPQISPRGVSSYPQAVPLAKTWLASIAGDWNEPLVNSLHPLWYLCSLGLLFFFLRRRVSLLWSLIGVYILGSLPLFLLHGTNAYADAFLAAHVLLAIGLPFLSIGEEDEGKSMSYLRVGAVASALLTFTKNEGLLIHLLPLAVLMAALLVWRLRSGRTVLQPFLWYLIANALVAGPWLLWKLLNGLTFGNAKSASGLLTFSWQSGVLYTLGINHFSEGHLLLLSPLLLLLLVWRWRTAFGRYAFVTAFLLIVLLGQTALYLFSALSIEALKQTGYLRGVIQVVPLMALLLTVLAADGWKRLRSDEW